MNPENHVEPPDLAGLIPISPKVDRFWTETGRAVDWIWYLWTGPRPNIEVSLRNVYPATQLSAQAIYQNIIDVVERLKIPGIRFGRQILHESGPFSPYRAYLQIRREFSEFLVCAAPVGESYLLAVRKIDRFPHVKWFHYLPVFGLLGLAFLLGAGAIGFLGGVLVMAMVLSLIWSVFRYAAHAARSWFSEHLPEIPWLGPLYLRWFRPDSYYRQDVHAAFVTLVDSAIREVISGLEQAQAVRLPAEAPGGPVRRDPHAPK